MRLLVVILNYRTADLTVDCLRSLAPEVAAMGETRAVVVDNDSGDASAEKITAAIAREEWGAWASVMPLERNGGFSFGNNAAVRAALAGNDEPRYVLLLNPDTLVKPGALRLLVDFMEAHREVGICGGSLEDGTGTLQHTAHRFPSPLGELDRGARLGALKRLLSRHVDVPPQPVEAQPCDWVSGASMMVRREVFEKVGLMDEGYFLYFDEVDFCARAARAGFAVWYVPAARIVHFEGQSTGMGQGRKRRGRYWYESRRRFFVKEYGVLGLMAGDVLWAVGRFSFFVRRCLRLARVGSDADPKWFAYDLLVGDLKALLSGQLFGIRGEGGRAS